MTILGTEQPFFSIVVPTYNRKGYIIKALESIHAQEFFNYEVIVVDDGSTDNTKEVIKEFIKKNPRIKYYSKQNEERSIARNYGIHRSTGRYISFLDSDDLLYPDHLRVAFALLKRNNFPEVGHLGYEHIDTDGNTILIRDSFNESFKEKLIHENIIHGNAIFIREDIVKEVNFIPSRLAIVSEDWYLWLRLAARYPFYFNNKVTSAVVQHGHRSLMNIDPDGLIASTDIVVESLKRDIPFLIAYKSKVSSHFADHYTFVTLVLAMTKSRRVTTLKYLIKAILYDPQVVFRKRFLASVKHLLPF